MVSNEKTSERDWDGKVLRIEPIMCNDFSKSTKGYKNSGRIEDNQEQQESCKGRKRFL
jgi:hypothetical protein